MEIQTLDENETPILASFYTNTKMLQDVMYLVWSLLLKIMPTSPYFKWPMSYWWIFLAGFLSDMFKLSSETLAFKKKLKYGSYNVSDLKLVQEVE